jgi:hypothetical protein
MDWLQGAARISRISLTGILSDPENGDKKWYDKIVDSRFEIHNDLWGAASPAQHTKRSAAAQWNCNLLCTRKG